MFTKIQKPTESEKDLFLQAMLQSIGHTNDYLTCLEERYQKFAWTLISPCYFNFRDALYHYQKAYNTQEVIQLYCEHNAMQEHLHRALKDGCIKYLQLLNECLGILYQYSYEPDRLTALQAFAQSLSTRTNKDVNDIFAYGIDIDSLNDSFPDESASEDEVFFLSELLFIVNYHNKDGTKAFLQKAIHELRNLELDTRDCSMHIEKPFSAESDSIDRPPPIDVFLTKCDAIVAQIEAEGLVPLLKSAKFLNHISSKDPLSTIKKESA